jgi:hypothetical protein
MKPGPKTPNTMQEETISFAELIEQDKKRRALENPWTAADEERYQRKREAEAEANAKWQREHPEEMEEEEEDEQEEEEREEP